MTLPMPIVAMKMLVSKFSARSNGSAALKYINRPTSAQTNAAAKSESAGCRPAWTMAA